MAYPLVAEHPPCGWDHLPLKTDHPRHIMRGWARRDEVEYIVAPKFCQDAVTWGPRAGLALAVLRDERLPWWELGLRPAFEAQSSGGIGPGASANQITSTMVLSSLQ